MVAARRLLSRGRSVRWLTPLAGSPLASAAVYCLTIVRIHGPLLAERHSHRYGLVDALVSNLRPPGSDRLPDTHSTTVAASTPRGLTSDLLQAVAATIFSHVEASGEP